MMTEFKLPLVISEHPFVKLLTEPKKQWIPDEQREILIALAQVNEMLCLIEVSIHD